MHSLTRELRFSINPADAPPPPTPTNSHAGHPPHTSLASHYFTLAATLTGPLQPSGYLRNIKDIDSQLRSLALPLFQLETRNPERGTPPSPNPQSPHTLLTTLYDCLKHAWPPATLSSLKLSPTPFLSYELIAKELPMTRLSQKFEFSASHRLHNPALSDADNRACYGKCNNPHGHGHNYELQVTLVGSPDPATGLLVDIPAFERTVAETVIARFDHKNLNAELPEFQDLIPSVENIAAVIHRLLKPHFTTPRTRLASVTVWETPKTWCEYSDPLP
jgi:6-pyruvoyltetrahydropterin/6-carboxytetrahydropterin synthase